jgi:hypothetical protein
MKKQFSEVIYNAMNLMEELLGSHVDRRRHWPNLEEVNINYNEYTWGAMAMDMGQVHFKIDPFTRCLQREKDAAKKN